MTTEEKTAQYTTACSIGLHRVCPGTYTIQDPKTLEITPGGTCSCLCHGLEAPRRNHAENA